MKKFTGIENDHHGILQIGVYKSTEVDGRDFITESRLYLENQKGQQVIILFQWKATIGRNISSDENN